MATVRCSRGSRVRLDHGFAHTKEIPTSPGRPHHSFHRLWAAAPVTMMRGATPRWYSCTASVTRSRSSGVGLPSLSAGVPRTTIVSKLWRFALLTGAKWRASIAQSNTTKANPRQAAAVRTSGMRRHGCFRLRIEAGRCAGPCVDLDARLDAGLRVGAGLRAGGVIRSPSSNVTEDERTPVQAEVLPL